MISREFAAEFGIAPEIIRNKNVEFRMCLNRCVIYLSRHMAPHPENTPNCADMHQSLLYLAYIILFMSNTVVRISSDRNRTVDTRSCKIPP